MQWAFQLLFCLFGLFWVMPALAADSSSRPWALDSLGWSEIDPGIEVGAIGDDKAESWAGFRNGNVDVWIVISAVPRSAEEVARELYDNLKGLERDYPNLNADTPEPMERNGTWVVESVMGATRDIWYITASNGRYSLLNVSARRDRSLEPGKALLKKLRPDDPTLFPRSYE